MTSTRSLRELYRLRERRSSPAASHPLRWPAGRTAVAIASVVFLSLAGTGVAQAVWTAAAVTSTASVRSDAVTITQTGFAELATTYTSTALTTTKPITLTNGNVPASFSLVLGAAPAASDSFAGDISVRTWPLAAGTCGAPPQSGVTEGTWAATVSLSGDLAAGATARYCVQTSISHTVAGTRPSTSMTAHMDLHARAGNWTSPHTIVSAVQSVVNTAPRALVAGEKTDSSIELSWSAPEDSTVTHYQVYRDTAAVVMEQSATTFTDTGREPNTPYSYTVYSLDASGTQLAVSNMLVVSTDTRVPTPGTWYHVVTADKTCVTAADGPELTAKPCSPVATVKFGFVADGSDFKIVANTNATVWDSPAKTKNFSKVTLKTDDSHAKKAEQRFTLLAIDGSTATFQIRSVEEITQCLQSADASLTMQACDTTAPIQDEQKFTLREATQ
ncbi:fibronectin type III domain-containing protein [Cryobacterium sp. Y11]|uniref:fibronectin type III domain-containing protein n=1 Tax=Cryobacterium sp. Y11 TaxID=2045016 RepID=UPI000CE4B494|nr:fibronectin type III domain-containing protein [Cryobacterium sp. Y11]